jgi:hypothetical protein
VDGCKRVWVDGGCEVSGGLRPGLCCLSSGSAHIVLACPGMQKGHVRVEVRLVSVLNVAAREMAMFTTPRVVDARVPAV